MKYQFEHDGFTSKYIVNGTVYNSLNEVPEEHRQYFRNMDKNNDGIPDDLEMLMKRLKSGQTGGGSATDIIKNLLTSLREQPESSGVKDVSHEDVKDRETRSSSPVPNYNRSGNTRGPMSPGEQDNIMSTLLKILFGVAVGFGIAWFFGFIDL